LACIARCSAFGAVGNDTLLAAATSAPHQAGFAGATCACGRVQPGHNRKELTMGAALVIPLIVIVLAVAGYLLYTLFAAGRGAATAAKSLGKHGGTGETAAHSDERTKLRDVETKPPQD
jgi:hypothetical protein